METLYKWMLEVIHLIIIGLFYLFGAILLIINFISDGIFVLDINYENYKLVILFIILLISYIIGFVINKASQGFIWMLRPKDKVKFIKTVRSQSDNPDRWFGYYSSLVMIRHLIISVPILGVLLAWYFLKIDNCKLGLSLFTVSIIFTIFLYFAYRQLRIQVEIIDKENE